MLKSRRFWIGLVFIVVFLALFFYRVDFMEMGRALITANYIFVLPALAVYLVGVWFRALRWKYLLHPLGNFASIRLFPLVIIGFMVNNLVPGRLGILVRAYILGEREGVSKIAAGATVLVENVFDGLALLFFIAAISFLVPLPDWVGVITWVAVAIFVGCLIILLLIILREDFIRRLVRALINVFPQRWRPKLGDWLDFALTGLKLPRQPGRLLAISITSLLVWLCEGGMFYLLSLCFGLGQPFYVMLVVMAIATLSWMVLVTPGGLGPFDYFGRETLKFFGVGTAVASAAILLIHAALLLPMIALGFVFLWLENLSLARVMPRRAELADEEGE